MKTSILIVFMMVILPGCTAPKVSITNIEWKLVKMYSDDASSLKPRLTLSLSETDTRANGHAGCNQFFGTYETAKSTIRISGFGSTKMFCKDKMKIEEKYLETLRKAQSYKVKDNKLYLLSEGDVILEFTR